MKSSIKAEFKKWQVLPVLAELPAKRPGAAERQEDRAAEAAGPSPAGTERVEGRPRLPGAAPVGTNFPPGRGATRISQRL
jgi:hypothetical protein